MRKYNIVYVCTHGSRDGFWIQELNRNANGTPTLYYDDRDNHNEYLFRASTGRYIHYKDLSTMSLGNNCKWFIIAGCAQLNMGVEYKNKKGEIIKESIDGSKDAKGWANALLRNNNLHGILAYKGSGPSSMAQLDVINEFVNVAKNKSIIESWRIANEKNFPNILDVNKNWAMVYNSRNTKDTLTNLTSNDNLKGGSREIYYEGYMLGSPIRIYQ